MAKRINFQDMLPIYRSMEKLEDSKYKLIISNEEILNSLTLALDESNSEDSGIAVIQGDYENIKINNSFVLSVRAPRKGMGILAENLDTYLKANGAKSKERNNYYLIDCDYSPSDPTAQIIINKYRDILRLISFLSESAHYLDTSKEELIFYKNGRFIVPISYSSTDLKNLKSQPLELIEKLISDKLHKEQKLKILEETLISMLEGVKPAERFKFMLENLDELYSKALTGYNIFAADFTFEKAVSEVNTFKVDTITKIHKAITDIQAQVLGIPVATFVALSQLKKTTSLNSQFAANTAIYVGAIIFCALLIGFLVNQKATLDTISSEVDRQEDSFKKKFGDNKKPYETEFKKIRSRLLSQYAALYGIGALDILMFLSSSIYYIVHTRPIYDILF
ncbi:MAG: hypothetical protein AB7E55_05340 [Pigmentiphaga sp.]